MSTKWRRYEVLAPLRFNDGRKVPEEWLGEAIFEIIDHFGAVSFETQRIEGHWMHEGVHYKDDLSRILVDLPDTQKNRKWMKAFKAKWKKRLEQLELWMISYRIDLE
ncbi:MAG: hypothetical protein U0793_01750 [Gemmataceae bacterium]|mgnify:CR=1 FL=1